MAPTDIQPCEICHGLGRLGLAIGSRPCTYCDEVGVVEIVKRKDLKLPDVGPVTEDSQGYEVDGHHFGRMWSGRDLRREVARYIAVMRYVEQRESPGTSHDNEVSEVERVLLEHGVTDDEGHGTVREIAAAVIEARR